MMVAWDTAVPPPPPPDPPSTEFFHPFSGTTWDAPEGTSLHYEYNYDVEFDGGLTGNWWFAIYAPSVSDDFAEVLVMDGPHPAAGTTNLFEDAGSYIITATAVGIQPGILYEGPDTDYALHPLTTSPNGFSGFFATI